MLSQRLLARLLVGVIGPSGLALGWVPATARAQAPAEGAAPALPPGVVATVNGIPIRRSAIEDLLWREWGPVYLSYGIRSKIVRMEAERRGITVTPEELKARMEEYQMMFNSVPGRQPRDWELFIQRFGREDVEERQRDELLAEKIGEEEANKTTLTEAEKARVRADLVRAAHKVHVRHVLVGIGAAYGGRTEAQARARAEEARARLASGADWDTVAREYSDDVSTREAGGDLGFFTRDQMVKPMEDAAFSTTPGDTLHVIRVPEGISVLQVIERQDTPPTEEDIQKAFDETLIRKKETARTVPAWYPAVEKAYKVVSVTPYERAAPAKATPKAPAPKPARKAGAKPARRTPAR